MLRAAGVVTGAIAVVMAGSAGPASAAVNDSFTVWTTDYCGAVDYVDYGPGAPGGGNNDDYLVVHDYCGDGHGVRVRAYLYQDVWNPGLIGTRYNGNGLAGAPVIWDPYREFGNVDAGDVVSLEVCLVDGANDPTPFRCVIDWTTSADG